MWKFVSRRIRDTFERGLNHFEKRSSAGVVNSHGSSGDDNKRSCLPCRWFYTEKCWNSQGNGNDTRNKKWNEHINRSWMGAITWSSALVLGWYASQILNLAQKYHSREQHKKLTLNSLVKALCPHTGAINKEGFGINSNSSVERIINNFTPTVQFVSNEHNSRGNKSTDSGSGSTTDSSSDLGDVLNSIENKLGLASIENGQYEDGLNLLRSAANRRHAPALYNLGLCYEMGLGVTIDEKAAMEFYKSAAALEHPGALYNLGIYYGQGRGGLQQNSETAARLLRLAAVQGQQEAIEALKSLDLDVKEPPLNDFKMWSFPHNDIVPTHTALFVDNINFKNVSGETTVF